MRPSNTAETVRGAIAEFNGGDRFALGAALGRDFFGYAPADDEPGAAGIIGPLILDVAEGFPDLAITLDSLEQDGDDARGQATMRGTNTRALWGVPATGRPIEWTVAFSVRPVREGLAFSLDDLSMPAIIGMFRQLEFVNAADEMHLPTKHATSMLPEFLLRLAFNGEVADKACSHLGEIRASASDLARCSRCGPDDIWPALRLCLICGNVGCCDTSMGKHARSHFEETGHALMRSLRPGETWGWCYADGVFLGGSTLAAAAGGAGA